tara:strand:- start:5921 stop:6163 length:243 start_codon:yes stop_codon:yes gene_type:complete
MGIENIELIDIKYEIDEILNKSKSIKNTTEKLKEWEGKPIYDTSLYLINKWKGEIKEHKSNINYFYAKFKINENTLPNKN